MYTSSSSVMNFDKKSISDIDVRGKKVLLRCDFNIPLDRDTGEITDDGRITSSLPTINYLLEQGAAIIACSHLGRPKGKWNDAYSLKVVGKRLAERLNTPVKMSEDVIGDSAASLAASLVPGEIMLLENLRFHPEEEANDAEFAKKLASFADVYVSDAFGCVHRAHASIVGVTDYLPSVAGFLLERELYQIGNAVRDPKRPLIAMLGGSKISDKLGVIVNLIEKADTLIIGGGMAYTFIKARGGKIGDSIHEDDKLDYARDVMKKAEERGVRLLLPIDSVVAESIDSTTPRTVPSNEIPDGLQGFDIGETTVLAYVNAIMGAGTVIWNGPMGVFEKTQFENGTRCVSEALAVSKSIVSVIGGGDSAAAIRKFGLENAVSHVSTGGGATLEFLEGRTLPGIACLPDKNA